MGVDTAESKGGNTCFSRNSRLFWFPGFHFRLDLDAALVQGAVIREGREIQGGGQAPFFHGQYGFNEASSSGCSEQMANHGFDGPNGHSFIRAVIKIQQPFYTGGFHLVPHRGAGTVAFHVLDICRGDACLVIGRLHGPNLSFTSRSHQVAFKVIGCAYSCDDGMDGVLAGNGILQSF